MTKLNKSVFRVCPFVLVLLLGASVRAQTPAIWNGTVGDWTDAGRWNTPQFPNNGSGTQYLAFITGGSVNLNQSVSLNGLSLSNGTIAGNNSITLISDALNWGSGQLNGVTILANGGVDLSGSVHSLTGGALIDNTGVANWSSGDIATGLGSMINNQGTGEFRVTGDFRMIQSFGGATSVFNNMGTFTKSAGTGTTLFNGVEFHNSGVVNAESGIIEVGVATSNGAWNLGTAGTVRFGFGTRELNTGTTISGNGTIEFASGMANLNNGTYNVGGSSRFTDGDITFAVDATTNRLDLVGTQSDIRGPATLTANGLMTWTAGQIDSGTVQANGGIDIAAGSHHMINGGTLSNSAVANWIAGDIRTGTASTINNQASGEFRVTGDDSMRQDFGGTASTFNNEGTFTKSAGLGATNFTGVVFNNTGIVNANSGVIEFESSDFIQTAGTLSLNGGNVAAVANSDVIDIRGGQVIGNGTILGDVDNSGGTISAGFSAGQITIDGELTLGNNSKLFLEIGGLMSGTEHDFLDVTGNANLDGILTLDLINGFENNIQIGDTFTLLSSGNLGGAFDNVVNGGMLSTQGVDFDVFYGTGSSFAANNVVVQATFVGVPEPSGTLLLMIMTGLMFNRRRR